MLEEHIGYLSDGRRTELFRAAICQAVRPGDVVADLGCGSGILGLLALQAGASRVYAIDTGAIVHVAEETFARAGFAGQATVIRGHSHRLELPESVDVLVCDHVGYFGFDYSLLSLLDDARARFLKPGGRIVPSALSLMIAPVESSDAWDKAARWRSAIVPHEFHWVHEASVNSKHAVSLAADALVAPAASPLALSFAEPSPDFLKLEATFHAARPGILHGIAGFFACRLFGNVGMTNAPGAQGRIDRPQAFLPLPEPVAVTAGEPIAVTVTARPGDDLIAWDVKLPERGKKFRSSTLKSMLIGAAERLKSDPAHKPLAKSEARLRARILALCDGTRTAADITEAILTEHPAALPSAEELRRFVLRVIEADTR